MTISAERRAELAVHEIDPDGGDMSREECIEVLSIHEDCVSAGRCARLNAAIEKLLTQ